MTEAELAKMQGATNLLREIKYLKAVIKMTNDLKRQIRSGKTKPDIKFAIPDNFTGTDFHIPFDANQVPKYLTLLTGYVESTRKQLRRKQNQFKNL
jgi:hypothetical protein